MDSYFLPDKKWAASTCLTKDELKDREGSELSIKAKLCAAIINLPEIDGALFQFNLETPTDDEITTELNKHRTRDGLFVIDGQSVDEDTATRIIKSRWFKITATLLKEEGQ